LLGYATWNRFLHPVIPVNPPHRDVALPVVVAVVAERHLVAIVTPLHQQSRRMSATIPVRHLLLQMVAVD
jgi:hypothetical protein